MRFSASAALSAALLLTLPAHSPAQTPATAQPASASSITEASIRGHMEFLASDALNGRGSGTRDEWIAAEYIASHLRRWGLEPMGDRDGSRRSFVQTIEMRATETTAPPVLTAGSLRLTHGREILVQQMGTLARASGRLVTYRPGVTVPTGAIVLLPETAQPATQAAAGSMTDAQREALTAERAALASASVVIVPETPQLREGWAQAASRLPTGPSRAVNLAATAAPRATRVVADTATFAALRALPSGSRALFDAETKYSDTPTYTWNVVAMLPGSDESLRRDVILLSAHLDHVGMREQAKGDDKIYNGADDDASGTVAVMEIAGAMAHGPRPKRTVVFAWFGSEERGGAGSNYFAELPVVPLDRIVANLQFEMIGRPDPKVPAKTLWLTGYERSNLGPELAKRGARLVQDPHPDQSFFTRSDNIRFARKGIPAHTVSSFGLHTDYHQPSDEVSTIDFAHMTEAIQSMLEPIRWLANDTFRPEWVPGGRPR